MGNPDLGAQPARQRRLTVAMLSILKPVTGAFHRATRQSTGILLPRCAWFGSAGRTESFALGIVSRYGAGSAQVAPVESVLRATALSSASDIFQMITTLSVRPAFVTRLLATFRTSGPGPDATPLPVMPSPRIVEREVARTSRLVFERIFARERRTDAAPVPAEAMLPSPLSETSSNARSPSALDWREPHDVMTLRRSPTASSPREAARPAVAAARLPLPNGNARSGSRAAVNPPPSRSAVQLSAGDLGRLTDEVVRVIDRRIIARRERKGVI